MGAWQNRLDDIMAGTSVLPDVVERMQLGRLTFWEPGRVVKEWRCLPEFCIAAGTGQQALFGGYIAALADQTLAFSAMTVLQDTHYFRTSDLRMSYFHIIREGLLRIEGWVENQGRQLMHVGAKFVREDGKVAVQATAVQILLPVNAEVANLMATKNR